MTQEQEFDIAVIGAGVLGCTMARALARYRLAACVLEAADDVGTGATKANSGVLYAGFHPHGGSVKGLTCVRGNAAYDRIAAELGVPLVRCGGLYVAFGPAGLERIEEKRRRAHDNGLGWLDVITGDEARELEPRLSERAIAALVAPTTAVISPFQLVLASARNAAANGVAFAFGFRVVAIERAGSRWRLIAQDGRSLLARFVANLAGEEAALLDAHVHPVDYEVGPRRGQFVVFDKQTARDGGGAGPIRHVLYQAQETDEGGTLLAPTADGNLIAGPTSEDASSFADAATTREGIGHVLRVARKLVPDLDEGRIITAFSGIRANITNVEKGKKDFVVRASAPGLVSLLGIKNPGITCAPALVDDALDLLRREGLRLERDPSFDPRDQGQRVPTRRAGELPAGAGEGFDQVICRCEHVTAGDVRAEMRGIMPPASIEGMKRRLRCGMGRCQGMFCGPRVAALMAQERGCRVADIPQGDRGGRLSQRRVK